MATAKAVTAPEPTPTQADARAAMNDFVLLAIPTTLYRQLSDVAMQRNMTLSQLMATALTDYIKKTE
jgi:hypothetical protein